MAPRKNAKALTQRSGHQIHKNWKKIPMGPSPSESQQTSNAIPSKLPPLSLPHPPENGGSAPEPRFQTNSLLPICGPFLHTHFVSDRFLPDFEFRPPGKAGVEGGEVGVWRWICPSEIDWVCWEMFCGFCCCCHGLEFCLVWFSSSCWISHRRLPCFSCPWGELVSFVFGCFNLYIWDWPSPCVIVFSYRGWLFSGDWKMKLKFKC